MTERNYKKEYEDYHARPEQIKRRAARNKARRHLEKEGKVSKGDGISGGPRNSCSKDATGSCRASHQKRAGRMILI